MHCTVQCLSHELVEVEKEKDYASHKIETGIFLDLPVNTLK